MKSHKLKITVLLSCLIATSVLIRTYIVYSRIVKESKYLQLTDNSMRLVRNPVEYQDLVRQMSGSDSGVVQLEALMDLEAIIPTLTDEALIDLALKVVDELDSTNVGVDFKAAFILNMTIPTLTNEALIDLALKVRDRLDSTDAGTQPRANIKALEIIIPTLTDNALKKDLVLKVIDKLDNTDADVRLQAINTSTKIMPTLTMGVLKDLAPEVIDKLDNADANVRLWAMETFDNLIIPSVSTDVDLRGLVLKVIDKIDGANADVQLWAISNATFEAYLP